MAEIYLNNLTKRFGDFTAIDNIDIRFTSGTVICLLGPSGCGKTTLMRMIAGLETPTAGRIFLRDRDVTHIPTRKRNIGMVFQYPVMYHPLSVYDNIAEPLRRDKKITATERNHRVENMLDLLDMRDLGNAFIEELDAGQRQKVAVGRAVARQTEVVLFDEPTTNMEIHAKFQLIRAFKKITQQLKQTIIYVTHDQTEAMTIADNIALMKDGKILQCAPPRELYNNSVSTFGGWFLGNPGMNFLQAKCSNGKLTAPLLAEAIEVANGFPTEELSIGVRPEQIRVLTDACPESVSGLLLERTLGIAGMQILRISIDEQVLTVKTDVQLDVTVGEQIQLLVARDKVAIFSAGKRVN